MPATDLNKALDKVATLVAKVDRHDPDHLFDCLAIIELVTRNAITDHSYRELLRAQIDNLKVYSDLNAVN